MNKNPTKFQGKTIVEVKTEKSNEMLPTLITESKDTQPLLGLKRLEKLETEYKETNHHYYQNCDQRRKEKNVGEYNDLFKNNHTIKDLTIDIQLQNDSKPTQHKGSLYLFISKTQYDKNWRN